MFPRFSTCNILSRIPIIRLTNTQSLPPLPVLSQEDWTRQQDLLKKYEKDKVSDKVTVKEILPEND